MLFRSLAAPPRRPRSPSHVLPTPVTPPTTLLATPPASTASSKPLSALPYVRASFARTRSPKAPNGTTKTDRPALPSLLAARSRRHRKRVRWLSFRREFRCSVRESLGGRRRTTARGGSALRGIMLMPRRWREGMASDTRSIDAWRSSNRTRPGRGRILSLFGHFIPQSVLYLDTGNSIPPRSMQPPHIPFKQRDRKSVV